MNVGDEMTRKKLEHEMLMEATEKLLLEQGYGGFNFSALSSILNVGRSTLYEYYGSKDELVADYMTELMINYTDELKQISIEIDAEKQLIRLIELMIKYAHIHDVLLMIPLMQSDSKPVQKVKADFVKDHLVIINYIIDIVEYGKEKLVVKKEIPTNILVNLLFNTINKPSSLDMDIDIWAKWVWEIISAGITPKK